MMRICLVVADATRARIYSYEHVLDPSGPREQLREERDLVDPARRQRASDLFSDNSGSSHTGARGYAFDDHRDGHLRRLDDDFARRIVAEVDQIVRDRALHRVILIASSRMLGSLRQRLAPVLQRDVTVEELEKDFTKLTTPELRDRLADLDLVPARPRLQFANR